MKIETLAKLDAAVAHARKKHPGPTGHRLAALMEEVGELAKALLESASWADIEGEAAQVGAVAIRIIEEGEGSFGRSPPPDTGAF